MNLRALTQTRSADNPASDRDDRDVSAEVVSPAGRPRSRFGVAWLAGWIVRLVVVACLSIDAYVHFDLAHDYDPIRASVSQGTLFRYEAAAAIAAGAILLITGRTFAWIFAF